MGRVLHVTPTYFDDVSVIGGGERFPTCLAAAMAERVETTLLSFGPRRVTRTEGNLRIVVLPTKKDVGNMPRWVPLLSLWREISRADVIHCHQYRVLPTVMAILLGGLCRKPVYVTDHGGRQFDMRDRGGLDEIVAGFLPVSRFSQASLPAHPRTIPIYGGVTPPEPADEQGGGRADELGGQRADELGGQPADEWADPPPRDSILFVGRLMPHKGINYLIDAVDPDTRLNIVGRPYDTEFVELLQSRAAGKNVRFITDAGDEEVRELYRRAIVTVLPSVYQNVIGPPAPLAELLGLVLLESMSHGTPVICTEVGGMPEIVDDGETGLIVPPNDAEALGAAIDFLIHNPDETRRLARTP